jgi:Protein of unknown function (DUF2914)
MTARLYRSTGSMCIRYHLLGGLFMKRLMVLAGFLLSTRWAAADDSPLKVVELTVCEEVVDRSCQAAARSFAHDIETVSCLSKIDGATGEAFVTHVWMFEGKELRRVKLPVKTSSYRTWSSKRVRGLPGKWKVEVFDPLDRSIGVVDFTVEPPKGMP